MASYFSLSYLLVNAKSSFYSTRVQELSGNQKALFNEMNHLLHKPTETPLPTLDSLEVLAKLFAKFFSQMIEKIRRELCGCVQQLSPTCSRNLGSNNDDVYEISSFRNVSVETF